MVCCPGVTVKPTLLFPRVLREGERAGGISHLLASFSLQLPQVGCATLFLDLQRYVKSDAPSSPCLTVRCCPLAAGRHAADRPPAVQPAAAASRQGHLHRRDTSSARGRPDAIHGRPCLKQRSAAQRAARLQRAAAARCHRTFAPCLHTMPLHRTSAPHLHTIPPHQTSAPHILTAMPPHHACQVRA